MLRAALWMLALAGCDVVFRVDQIKPGDLVDAPPDAFALCAQPFLDDSFDDDVPCRTWGNVRAELGASVTESSGSLVVQPAPNLVGSRGGCDPVGAVPFGAGGVIVEVSKPIIGTDAEFTLLASGTMHLAVGVANGQIVFQNDIGTMQYGPAVLYSASAMRFWRIHPLDASTIAGEYSADGASWTQLGTLTVSVPTTASFGVLAGLNLNRGPQSAPDRAVYDRFVVCP